MQTAADKFSRCFLCSLTAPDATDFSMATGYTEATSDGEVTAMVIYLDLVMLLNFAVDLLLLLGANYLAGKRTEWPRLLTAAALGGVYGGICLLPGLSFMGNTFWRLIFLGGMAAMAFGCGMSALRRGVLFILLSMALGGIALGLGQGGWIALLASAAALAILCVLGFQRSATQRQLLQAEVNLAGRKKRLMALHDTGNTLRDPITGCNVLVVDPDVAWELLGLTDAQLATPADTLASARIPGLRLIPYRSVGQPAGLLLGIRVDSLKIDGKARDPIVAFAPHKLGNGGYQALAGGIL